MNRLNLVGKKFGKLTVMSFHSIEKKRTKWLCRCECGIKKVIRGNSLTYKNGTKSCGKASCHGRALKKGESSFNYIYLRYKQNAIKRNISFNLNKKQFKNLIMDNCHYCEEKPKNKVNIKNYLGILIYNGIDRKNNNYGYSQKNCVPCCKECNFLKKDTSYSNFLKRVAKIYNTRIKNAHFL